MTRAVAGALLAAALGCAQPGTPPGGPVDRSPPRVTEVSPAAFDTLTDLNAPVVIRFDERISERLEGVARFQDAVIVSPVPGDVHVDRGRSSLEIRPEGGWAPDRVYRVVVLPVFRDLFGNQRTEPVELVFSTGAPIPETAVAGFVQDRITGGAVPDARVVAIQRPDSIRYVAVSDTGGFFALRFLPPGDYGVEAWLDQDRDRAPGFFEAQDTASADVTDGDTLVVELSLLPMDTTPAQLARAEAIDSAKIRLLFDDYFAVGSVAGDARVFLASDSSLVSDDGRLIHGSRLDSIQAAEEEARRAEEARLDSLQRLQDTIPADSAVQAEVPSPPDTAAGAVPDSVRARRPAQAGIRGLGGQERAERAPATPREPLPSRELILILTEPLVPDTAFYVEVEGVVNIRGVPGGGGTASFRSPAPDTTAADSTMEASDTVPPDVVPSDTVPPDVVPPDTVPPDTVPPDTVPRPRPVGEGGRA